MREVRMTFGEHLEELRRRIIFCLIYLAVGVGICFAYGKPLLEWTLKPHQKAFAAAQRDRLVARMTKKVLVLDWLTDPRSGRGVETPPVQPEEIRWEVLFADDIVQTRMRARLSAPTETLVQTLEGPLTPALRAAVARYGDELAEVLAQELTQNSRLGAETGFLPRLRKLERKLAEVNEKAGPTETQEAIGWGKDLKTVMEPVARFRSFLELRRDQIRKSDIALADLRGWVSSYRQLPNVLDELIRSIETSADDILKSQSEARLMVVSYLENFNAYLKVCLVFGIMITIPFLLYELWKFIGAGLHDNEQKYVVLFLPFSLGLFVAGAGFGYYAMIPIGLEFLAGWGLEEVDLRITLANYLGLFFTLTLVLGIVFQTPLVMIFFNKIGVVDVPTLRRMRRISIFLGVCLAVILTPPDPFSWSLMALPMIVLYEVGIFLCDFLEKKGAAAKATS
jgi:Tat protein translocase TatC